MRGPTRDRTVFRLLWRTARKRAENRRKRQRELMRQKKGGGGSDALAGLMRCFAVIMMAAVHAALGWMLIGSLDSARIVAAEAGGKVVLPFVYDGQMDEIRRLQEAVENGGDGGYPGRGAESVLEERLDRLAETNGRRRADEYGGSEEEQERLVRRQFEEAGLAGFVSDDELVRSGAIPPVFVPVAGFVFLWWLMMIVCQGEGLELDVQRRRHPMWEWVQSHPVRPVAAFAADLLSPMMANPVYFAAPVFWWVVFGKFHGLGSGLLMAIPVGLAFALAASCLNKALEISAMLRLSPRSRGAALGVVSWLGYGSMMLPLFAINAPQLEIAMVRLLAPLTGGVRDLPVPSPGAAAVAAISSAGALLGLGVWIAWWAANQGLQSAGGGNTIVRSRRRLLVGRNPLLRKELLWFWRDKGAVVQAILIPLTIASFQVFNMRGLIGETLGSWHGIAGVAILCGTYFLLVLGPKSLASEGAALWVATTWPHGLEDLLKAKARLWWGLSSLIAGLVMLVALWMFPSDWWKIGLVAVGWAVFGRSLAEKTVTLATAPSSSGEPEPVPQGKMWTAMLGTLAFSAGVFTETWNVAVMGVVFSSLTAAAMWQNFRARLPFLFDRWAEKLPPAPSLMHAMIGIVAMGEVIGLATVLVAAFDLRGDLWLARAVGYGVGGVIMWGVMHNFLRGRGVTAGMIWKWPREGTPSAVKAYGGALVAGLVLAGGALLYLAGLRLFPGTSELVGRMDQAGPESHAQHVLLLVMTVGMAPLAEEYLFRGMLFRALDREWGGWTAIVGSAAYFAIYHPPVSWLPVFGVGLACAWCFKKTARLGPCVLLHMAYNAVVVGMA